MHVWKKDREADALYLAKANLPQHFWDALACAIGETPSGGIGKKFKVDGDVLCIQRSYLSIERDGERSISITPGTLIRARNLREAGIAAASKAKEKPAIVEWED